MTKTSESLVGVILAWKRLLIRTTIAAAVVSVAVSLLLPRWYSAVATILPPSDTGSAGGIFELMTQLGRGGGGVGATRGAAQRLLGRSASVDLTIGVLKSRRTRGLIVDRFDLVEAYDVRTRDHAIKRFGKHLQVRTSPEGLIDVVVEDRDREKAAEMANAVLEVLDAFNRETSVDEARRTLRFIERCLHENRDRMENAANRLRHYQEEKGAIQLSEQTRVTVEAIAALQAEKTTREIQKRVLAQYTTPDQLDVQTLEAEIREIDRSIDALEGQTSEEGEPVTADLPGGLLTLRDIPALGLEYANLKREVMVQEKVYEFLTAQFEEARIREARDQETIVILDKATPPIRKSRPRRSIIVIVSTVLAFFASLALVLATQAILDRLDEPGGASLRAGLGPVVGILERLRRWAGPRADAPSDPGARGA